MTQTIRVVACLDVADGRVVKGVNFHDLRDAGNPVELAARYAEQGIDEIVFLDISATVEGRSTMLELVQQTAESVFIPLTVGGGVRTLTDVDQLLRHGADKVGINTAAITNPTVINDISDRFGNQVLTLSVDAKRESSGSGRFVVTTHGGRVETGLEATEWVKEAIDRGIGEVLLNSIDADGTTNGFDLDMIEAIREVCSVPLVASGGAGQVEHFSQAVAAGADAVLAASVFHFGVLSVAAVKGELTHAGAAIRPLPVESELLNLN